AAVAVLGALPRAALAAQPASTIGQLEPDAGRWMTWVIDSGSDLRPPQPDIGATQSEIDALQAFAGNRDEATLDQISYWDSGSPGFRWNEIAIAEGIKEEIAISAYRVLALVNVAIYDATIAAWDAKYRYIRPRPSEVDPTLTTVIPNPSSPSYPCEVSAA